MKRIYQNVNMNFLFRFLLRKKNVEIFIKLLRDRNKQQELNYIILIVLIFLELIEKEVVDGYYYWNLMVYFGRGFR